MIEFAADELGRVCVWNVAPGNDEHYWLTECDQIHTFADGHDYYASCPYCGGKLEVGGVTESRIELSPSCRIVRVVYAHDTPPDLYLEYIEHSSDHWFSDTETLVNIDDKTAKEIIDLLGGTATDCRPTP